MKTSRPTSRAYVTVRFSGSSSIGPDGGSPERTSYGDVLLIERVRAAVAKLNPDLDTDAHAEAIKLLMQAQTPSLVEENRLLHRYIVEGVPVSIKRDDGTISGALVRLIDFDDVDNNDWLAVNQYTVIENKANRRPDVVLIVNGMPLGVIELKNPGDENATLDGAFNQLQTYKAQIPSLFRTNAALIISDGIAARIGSLTADRERFMPWRTVDGKDVAPKGTPELETVLKGVFDRRRFLDLIKDFIVFGDTGSDVAKILAGYHQFHAVRHAVERTIAASAPGGDRRAGVIWHTQGSGKSLLMAFYAGQIVKHPEMENPTLVVLTDRNDLDDQLFGTFSMCKDLLRQVPQQAEKRDDLRKLLDRPSGGVIFTTLQKFSPAPGETEYPVLTYRRNVIVIADEAHRSQYGLDARVGRETGEISYGFAKYMRDALPKASFIGFTGTPIENGDVSTRAVFGENIDVYDISRAVEDGATVPIYYESRLARIELDADEKPKIDAEIDELTEDEAQTEQERLKRKWASVEALVGSEKRLALIAEDLVKHFEARTAALEGKGMIVCMSRRIHFSITNEEFAAVLERPDRQRLEGLRELALTQDLRLCVYEALHDQLSQSDARDEAKWVKSAKEKKLAELAQNKERREDELLQLRLYIKARYAVPIKHQYKILPAEHLAFLAPYVVDGDTWATFMAFESQWNSNRQSKGLEKYLPRLDGIDPEEAEELDLTADTDNSEDDTAAQAELVNTVTERLDKILDALQEKGARAGRDPVALDAFREVREDLSDSQEFASQEAKRIYDRIADFCIAIDRVLARIPMEEATAPGHEVGRPPMIEVALEERRSPRMAARSQTSTFLKWVFPFVAVVAISVLVSGWAISLGWSWFIVPIANVRPISFAEGIGLSIFLSIIGLARERWPSSDASKSTSAEGYDVDAEVGKALWSIVERSVIGTLGGLGGAWIWHAFAMPIIP